MAGWLQRHRHDGTSVHVHGVLGLVRQMGAPVFHLRDPRLLVRRTLPLFVRRPLLALPIQSRQILPRRRLHPRRLGQSPQELLIRLARVPPHVRPHPRVRFQRRRVHPHPPPLHHSPSPTPPPPPPQ